MHFTSDTHFSSARALELSRRPYLSVEAMDEAMINYWNSVVSPNEDVYHLGDFGDYDIVKKLNGRIHLILGNYETKDILEGKITKNALLEKGFASADEYLYIENFITGLPEIELIKLVHEPSKCDMVNPKVFNLFGHIHGRQKCKRFGYDVGVDGNYMTPMSSEDVAFFAVAIKNFYDEEVFL